MAPSGRYNRIQAAERFTLFCKHPVLRQTSVCHQKKHCKLKTGSAAELQATNQGFQRQRLIMIYFSKAPFSVKTKQ